MKTQSIELKTFRDTEYTTFAHCWLITRTDGEIFGFTSYDNDITFNDQIYKAATGFIPSAVVNQSDLSVGNLEVAGILDDTSITEEDLLSGRWDSAEVEIFEVNYTDLTMGKMIICTGTIGDISMENGKFTAELRSITQQLQQPVGEVYTASCPADLFDSRCKVNPASYTFTGTVSYIDPDYPKRRFVATTLTQADDYFGGGTVEFTTGLNTGIKMEVQASTSISTSVKLVLNLPFDIAIGDEFIIKAGCRKRRTEDCKNKFNNVINFRGFPDIPLNDKVLGNAGTK